MSLHTDLFTNISDLTLLPEEPLARHTSFRIGGPALLLLPRTETALCAVLERCREAGLPWRLLGAGTNILAPDAGVDGVVIGTRELCSVEQTGPTELEAACGATLARLANFAQRAGLTGLEFAHGIPGTVGGGVYMNAGAYGGELSGVVTSVRFWTPDGTVETVCGEALGFSYRHSAFMGRTGVVLSARFSLTPWDSEAILETMRTLAEKRRASQPLDLPSAGSTFRRPVGGYAAALIDQAGLRGLRVGGAAVSEKHAGFVVNLGGATCADVLTLMQEIQKRVLADSGIALEPEVRIW